MYFAVEFLYACLWGVLLYIVEWKLFIFVKRCWWIYFDLREVSSLGKMNYYISCPLYFPRWTLQYIRWCTLCVSLLLWRADTYQVSLLSPKEVPLVPHEDGPSQCLWDVWAMWYGGLRWWVITHTVDLVYNRHALLWHLCIVMTGAKSVLWE